MIDGVDDSHANSSLSSNDGASYPRPRLSVREATTHHKRRAHGASETTMHHPTIDRDRRSRAVRPGRIYAGLLLAWAALLAFFLAVTGLPAHAHDDGRGND